MINGAHVIVSSKDPKSDRAFFRDVLKFPAVAAGDGWLIFELPPAEAAFHPSEKNDLHELYFMCEDLKATMESLEAQKVECEPVQEVQLGSRTTISLPGGGKICLYQPKHPTATTPLPLPKDEWKLKANANYQEVMKTLMTLMTASLVLPIWFIRNFLPVGPTEPIGKYLYPWAYCSWIFLALALVCGMFFYAASAKFVKVVCGGRETRSETFFEGARDWSGGTAVFFFLLGLISAGLFFHGQTASHQPFDLGYSLPDHSTPLLLFSSQGLPGSKAIRIDQLNQSVDD